MLSEQELIKSAQAGNAVAFEQLIEEHQKRIFSIAYRIAGNQEDAADMAQEVLVKIFRNLKHFRGDSKFSTWLYRVATTTCLDEQKKQRRHTAYSLDEAMETEDGTVTADPVDTGPTPEEAMEQRAVRQAIHLAIKKLKEEKIVLYAGNNKVETTAGDLGLGYTNKKIIEEALSIGKKGTVLKRFLADRQLRGEGPIVLDLDFKVFESTELSISKGDANRWTVVCTLVLPVVIAGVGIYVYARRRYL